jgi:FtsP/CotA-like multicopper oxidase with cupredoxin domain
MMAMTLSVGGLGRPVSRRSFVRALGGTGVGFAFYRYLPAGVRRQVAALPGGTLDPSEVPKFTTPMLVPPVMPRAGVIPRRGRLEDYYEISVRQFQQQVLPPGLPTTTVWGYGPVRARSRPNVLIHHAPSLTIEARQDRAVRIKWINGLVDERGRYLPHLLPVDPTLHWANPPGGVTGRDSEPAFTQTPGRYTGPVPLVTHVHGAVGVGDESDGYPEAWYLPAAADIPSGYATHGTWYEFFAGKAAQDYGAMWGAGFATFRYPNAGRASTKWYHDHTLGMTRLNVYAGPAGFYIVRGGSDGDRNVLDRRHGTVAKLPGPAPREGDRFPSNRRYHEIPVAIQDRAFNEDGSLFYPDTRAFFDGIVDDLIPDGPFAPIWNPEFFGNMIMVNGSTWPFHPVEQRRYRLRFLNGCQSRFLILDFSQIPGVEVWAIGNEGGFLASPVNLTADHGNRLLMGLAERADLIVDFTNVALGRHVLRNLGPDEPFGGGEPGEPPEGFETADPATTGQILEFRVVPAVGHDHTTPPQFLELPQAAPLPREDRTRSLALIEVASVGHDAEGDEVEGPVEAVLGVVENGVPESREWPDPVTENPAVGDTEVWEIYNTTADAHPMHVHEIAFEVVNREGLVLAGDEVATPIRTDGTVEDPRPWETGVKDTVVALPGQVTRLRGQFEKAGQFVWHCHIVEHEDNEMMRPYRIGPPQSGQPD